MLQTGSHTPEVTPLMMHVHSQQGAGLVLASMLPPQPPPGARLLPE